MCTEDSMFTEKNINVISICATILIAIMIICCTKGCVESCNVQIERYKTGQGVSKTTIIKE